MLSSATTKLVEFWHSLPVSVRDWTTKVAVALAIAVAWHWYTRPPDATITKKKDHRKGIDRKALQPLPDDLVLEERVLEEKNKVVMEDQPDTTEKETKDAKESPGSDISTKNGPVEIQEASEETMESSEGRTLRTPTTDTPQPIVFRNTSRKHPGLQAFWHWCDTECSLFRVYSLATKYSSDSIPPFLPRSRQGQVQVSLRVTNRTHRTIGVYWLTYKGSESLKGRIRPQATWRQQTWIEHPWVFRDEDSGAVLLHYVPERIIPTCDLQPTVDEEDPTIGVHRFTLDTPSTDSPHWVEITDPVLPFPARQHFQSIEQAVDFALLHMHRTNYTGWDVLVKYLTNILYNPAHAKYRQIRVANPTFGPAVWQHTAARGLLLALGFVEQGAHVELGTHRPLTRDQLQMLSTVLLRIRVWKQTALPPQPRGADGYGRAGFGRAGAMS